MVADSLRTKNQYISMSDVMPSDGDSSGRALHTVKTEFEGNSEGPDIVDEHSCSPHSLSECIFKYDESEDFTNSLEFLSDGFDGGEVHDMEALNVLGMAPRLNLKEELQEGSSSGDKLSENDTMVDGDEKNGVPQSRRKVKVDWTPELHRKFVAAVEQLGVEKAIPSRILEMMGVHCLTRHNIASHLQKYRSHRRHLLAREAEAATWHHRRPSDPSFSKMRRDGTCWVPQHIPPHIQPRPSMGLPPLQPHPPPPHLSTLPPPPPSGPAVGMPLHVWGHPSMDRPPSHMWHPPPPPGWYNPDGTLWPYPMPAMDMWGHPHPAPAPPCYQQPVMTYPPPLSLPYWPPAPQLDNCLDSDAMAQLCAGLPDDLDLLIESDGAFALEHDESKYILDAAISEALANPFQPLPLGLKPPSIEKVMAELERQGIPTTAQPAVFTSE